jgi:hypothetical protein
MIRYILTDYIERAMALAVYDKLEAEYSVGQLRMMSNEVEQIIGRSITADEWNNL